MAWPALAVACGLPRDARGRVRVPSPAQHCTRAHRMGAPPSEHLFVVLGTLACHTHLVGGREVSIDRAPLLAWRRADPDAASGHAPHHHARPLVCGDRMHPLLCRGSGLPLLFLLAPATVHDAPCARPRLELAVRLSGLSMAGVRASCASTPAPGACA
jgi:hypothetical protein